MNRRIWTWPRLIVAALILIFPKALLEHQAELLALRGYAPPELREHDSYTGIADTRELAHWALREVVLDTRDATILTKDAA